MSKEIANPVHTCQEEGSTSNEMDQEYVGWDANGSPVYEKKNNKRLSNKIIRTDKIIRREVELGIGYDE